MGGAGEYPRSAEPMSTLHLPPGATPREPLRKPKRQSRAVPRIEPPPERYTLQHGSIGWRRLALELLDEHRRAERRQLTAVQQHAVELLTQDEV